MRHFLPVVLFALIVSVVRAQDPEPPTDEPTGPVFLSPNGPGHIGAVRGLAFSPDGKRLYSVGSDRTIQEWDTKTGKRLHVFRMPLGPGTFAGLFGVAASPDGKTLALRNRALGPGKVGEAHGTVHLLNLENGQIRWLDSKQPPGGTSVAFSPDGDRLVAGRFVWSGLKKPWEMGPGEVQKLAVLTIPEKAKTPIPTLSPDGTRLLYTGLAGGSPVIWSIDDVAKARADGKEPKPAQEFLGNDTFIAGCWHGQRPVLVDTRGVIHVFEGARATEFNLRVLLPRIKKAIRVTHMAAGGKDEVIVTGRLEHSTFTAVVNLANGSKSREGIFSSDLGMDENPVGAVTSDGKLAACSGGPAQNEIVLWDPATGKELRRLGGNVSTPLDVKWSTKGQTLCWMTAKDPRSGRQGPFTLDLEELQFREVPAEERNDARLFTGAIATNGPWAATSSGRNLTITKDGKETASTPQIGGHGITAFSLAGGKDPSWVAWGSARVFGISSTKDSKAVQEKLPPGQFVQSVAPSADGRYFAVTSDTQVIHVYAPEHRGPLLHIFQAGDDWVVWTWNGYFAASPGGEALLGWTVTTSYDRVATFHPASRLRARFYRPDVIGKVLETGSPKKALELADKAAGKEKGAGVEAQVTDSLPPQARLSVKVEKGVATVTATGETSADAQSLTSLQLYLDGRPASLSDNTKKVDSAKKKGESAEVKWVLPLPPGKHQLTVLARGTDTLAGSEPVEVEGPAPAAKTTAKLHILAAGVSKYANHGKGDANAALNLSYAAKDAEEIQNVLLQRSADGRLFSPGRKQLLRNEQATTRKLEEELKDLASDTSIKSGDLMVFYFSGHGERDESGKLYLLTHTADRSKPLGDSCLSGENLKELLAKVPCKVLMLLDACHSTAVGPKKRPATDDLTRTLIDEDCAVAVMTAAMGKEFALEGVTDKATGKPIENGLFTYALREALEGKAEMDEDGFVFVHDVYQHVFKRVRDLSGRKQNPFMALPYSVKPFAVVRQATPGKGSDR